MTKPHVEWAERVTQYLKQLDKLDDLRGEQIAELSDLITQLFVELAELRDELHTLAKPRGVQPMRGLPDANRIRDRRP
jgi:hypothetical protein